MPIPETPEERKLRLESEADIRKGLLQALQGYVNTQLQIEKDVARAATNNWKAAVDAVKAVQAAIHSGDINSYRDAMTTLTTANLDTVPVDMMLMSSIQQTLDVDVATAGRGNDAPERAAKAWQIYVQRFPAPGNNPQIGRAHV